MLKSFFTLLLIAIISIQANAQGTKPNLEHRLYPGTVTTLDGQIIKGYIANHDNEENQEKCTFYLDDHDGKSKTVYKPKDLLGYSVENFQYKSINYSGNISFGKAGRSFVFIAKPGAITTFIYFLRGEQLVWQKGDDEPVSNSSMLLSYRKSLLKLVGDDAELAAKIEGKEKGYGMLNLDAIVDEYNTWAASKK